ncbi:MAG: single-stranded-DNA-specific exonuclease [Planctomycetota bacterium]|jgi:single-stranded-DNA-specific exonuclease
MALWKIRTPDSEVVRRVAGYCDIPEVAASLLVNRGHTDPAEALHFLVAAPKGMRDPMGMPDMQPAVERLAKAIEAGENILVHGDYDVDGVTGTSLLVRMLKLVGANVQWHIPNRLVDGYSFGTHSVDRARDTNSTVVISVDNGTSAGETIAQLKAAGVDTIVTDHHEPPDGPLPDAVAIVNPKVKTSTYEWRELCGGAVAFKLAWGLAKHMAPEGNTSPAMKIFLEEACAYVAIATVCDVVPLIDENRIFARFGLRALAATKNHGLNAMLEICGLKGRELTAEDVGFQIGPRINASGRLGSAQCAVDLLLAETAEDAKACAQKLDDLNAERKEIERGVLEQALADVEEHFLDPDEYPVILVAGQNWHQGVVGIVAARLVDRYHRPAIVIGLDGAEGRGSARSIAGFSVLDAMKGGAEHMLRFGGHEQAAGCEVSADSITALRSAVCERAREMFEANGREEATLTIDAELPLSEITPALMNQIDRLEPFGEQNSKPLFVSSYLRLERPPTILGADKRHLRLDVRRGATVMKALAFGMADRRDELQMGMDIRLVHTPRWNHWRGNRNLELLVADFSVSS